jgi:hypothetical protein
VAAADRRGTDGWQASAKPRVLTDGKLALSRGPYKYTEKNEEGEDVDYWGTFNSIWRLQDDGSWKVVFDAGSPGSQPPDEIKALLDAEDDDGTRTLVKQCDHFPPLTDFEL